MQQCGSNCEAIAVLRLNFKRFLSLFSFFFSLYFSCYQMSNTTDDKQKEKEKVPVKEFLSRHVPEQLANSKKLCYRHRPDLIKRRQPDNFDFEQTQKVV